MTTTDTFTMIQALIRSEMEGTRSLLRSEVDGLKVLINLMREDQSVYSARLSQIEFKGLGVDGRVADLEGRVTALEETAKTAADRLIDLRDKRHLAILGGAAGGLFGWLALLWHWLGQHVR